jgi:hypothetical protein
MTAGSGKPAKTAATDARGAMTKPGNQIAEARQAPADTDGTPDPLLNWRIREYKTIDWLKEQGR